MALALHQQQQPLQSPPERTLLRERRRAQRRAKARAFALTAGAAALAFAVVYTARRARRPQRAKLPDSR
jgi:hypothetical protein